MAKSEIVNRTTYCQQSLGAGETKQHSVSILVVVSLVSGENLELASQEGDIGQNHSLNKQNAENNIVLISLP